MSNVWRMYSEVLTTSGRLDSYIVNYLKIKKRLTIIIVSDKILLTNIYSMFTF
jgi:hypothetical protein